MTERLFKSHFMRLYNCDTYEVALIRAQTVRRRTELVVDVAHFHIRSLSLSRDSRDVEICNSLSVCDLLRAHASSASC